MNTKCWEPFLPYKPQSVQGGTLSLKPNENESFKNLEMPNSWVAVIEVPMSSRCFVFKRTK